MSLSGFKKIILKLTIFFLCRLSQTICKKHYKDEVFNPTYENLTKLIEDQKIQNKAKLLNIFCEEHLILKLKSANL